MWNSVKQPGCASLVERKKKDKYDFELYTPKQIIQESVKTENASRLSIFLLKI